MKQKKNIALLITVASLGYFVDIYDLILFNIIKKDSLSSLNIDVNTYETVLFRWQMAGMLIGGLIWDFGRCKRTRECIVWFHLVVQCCQRGECLRDYC